MKRIGATLCLAIMMTLAFGLTVFGADFEVTSTTPKDGDAGMSLENMGFKVTFSQDVYNPDNEEFNAALCSIKGPDGKNFPCKVVFDQEHPTDMLVLAEPDEENVVEGDSEYTLTIQSGFLSADGQQLSDPVTVSFSTLNPRNNTIVSMVMMGVMMVAMVVAMQRAAKQEGESSEKTKKEAKEKVNPYKVAKETGKSVEEVLAEEQKRQEKLAAKIKRQEEKEAKERAKIEKYRQENKVDIADGNLKVPRPRPISEYSSYKAPEE